MDRLSALFELFDLPELTRMLRRTIYAGALVGVVALVVLVVLGYPLIGLGACIGLALGFFNIRLVTRSVARLGASGREKTRGPLVSQSVLRIGVTTMIVIVLAVIVPALGMGAIGGIAVFYFLFLASVMRSLLHSSGAAA
jgi:hypothetical protein